MNLEDLIRHTFRLPPEGEVLDIHGPGKIEGWDSLGHINLMNALESTYKITIGMDEMLGIETLADIKKLLNAKGAKQF